MADLMLASDLRHMNTGHLDLSAASRVLMISDLHLSPGFPELGQLFDDFLKFHVLGTHVLEHPGLTDVPRPDALIILGDLFDYWIGDDAAGAIGQSAHLDTLRRVVDAGVQVFFIHGNRDFLVGKDFAADTGVTLLDPFTLLNLGHQRILLCHGDELCTDDVEHQKFRAMVRDEAWQSDFLAKSLDERQQFAERARAESEHAKSAKSMEIMDVTLSAVDDAMRAAKVQWMVHGHTHRPALHLGHGNRVVLGDWGSTPSYIDISHETLTLMAGGGRPGGTITLAA